MVEATAGPVGEEIMPGVNLPAVREGDDLAKLPEMREMAQLKVDTTWANIALKSGLFGDIKSAAAGLIIVSLGRQLGVPAASALMHMAIQQGRLTIAPALLVGIVRERGKGDFDIVQCDKNGTILLPRRYDPGTKKWKVLGEVSFTRKDAEEIHVWVKRDGQSKKIPLMQKGNYQDGYVEDMFFARACGRMVRRYFQDVFMGPVNVTGEVLEGQISHPDVEGDDASVVDAEFDETTPPAAADKPAKGVKTAKPSELVPEDKRERQLIPPEVEKDPDSPMSVGWHTKLSAGSYAGEFVGDQSATYLENYLKSYGPGGKKAEREMAGNERMAVLLVLRAKKDMYAQQAAAKEAGEEVPDKPVPRAAAEQLDPEKIPIAKRSLEQLGEVIMIAESKHANKPLIEVPRKYLQKFYDANKGELPKGFAAAVLRFLELSGAKAKPVRRMVEPTESSEEYGEEE